MNYVLSSYGTPEADAKAAAEVLWQAAKRHNWYNNTAELDTAKYRLSQNKGQCVALLHEANENLRQADTLYQQLKNDYIKNQLAHRRSSMFPDARLSKNLNAARRHMERVKTFIGGLERAAASR